MESRIQRLFLAALLLGSGLFGHNGFAQENPASDDDELGQIITPDVERRTVKEDDLDSEDFELGVFFGLLSIEDFGTNEVQGATLSYHITEDFFVEAAYGMSKTQKTSYELLSGGVELLTGDQRDLSYYTLSLGYNVFPGQIYLHKWTFNTNFYVMAGGGNTEFAAKEYFTSSIGAGLRVYTTDWLALDISMRGYAFKHELFGNSKSTHNLESRIGLSLFF